MRCVICNFKVVDNGYNVDGKGSVTCQVCRSTHYPKFMRPKQYKRYWDAFNKKWRDENEVCNM